MLIGSGNIGANPPQSMDLQTTPRLKEEHYTTGRGGSGNIVKNTDEEIARAAQDIAPSHDEGHLGHDGPIKVGRGGAGNTFALSEQDISKGRERRASHSEMMKERGKALLEKIGMGGKKA